MTAVDQPVSPRRARLRPSGLSTRVAALRERALDGRERLLDRAEPVLARTAPALSTVTTAGWVLLAAILLGLYVGASRGWAELVAGAVCGAVVLVLALLWVIGPAPLRARIELIANRVQIGEQAMGRVVASPRSGVSRLPVRAELPVGKGAAGFSIPALARDGEHEEIFTVPTRRRGHIVLGPVRAVRADPFALVRRVKDLSDQVDLYVHPRTIRLDARKAGFLRDIEGVTTHDLSSSDVSFHALRDYVPGDDRRAIHWRTTARVGRLMVRQFEETRRSHLLVVLSIRPQDYLDPEDFETAVSAAASLGLQAMREEREVTIVTNSGRIVAPTGATLLDQMSTVELQSDKRDLSELASHALTVAPGASIATIITGGSSDGQTLRRARNNLPLDVVTFAIRCGVQLTGDRRRIGDLVVLDVPELDSLPRAIASLL
ncbi:DUF58 domain-containing protein [Yimella sp. cx-51]|uniref:DUF58 domain-containing protein n=1 Tax=Yimella sp. cx-51 TaxID=2770551 RepID=UPI00165E332D|nr:DUF58 domain-containing protein [Yimella sp. cx-51]MBC9955937.1 DUF58 domain-containing protein [Yimella sp. cx-51]QTH37523.1 DUF58 domain-containing protein [Yimella sp. cx-51]